MAELVQYYGTGRRKRAIARVYLRPGSGDFKVNGREFEEYFVTPAQRSAAKAPLAMPKNASTNRQYSGVNILILWGAVIERGFAGQSWLTFRQALSLGGHVRKGERGTTVVYADRFVPNDEKRRAAETGEEAQAIPFQSHPYSITARHAVNPGARKGRWP